MNIKASFVSVVLILIIPLLSACAAQTTPSTIIPTAIPPTAIPPTATESPAPELSVSGTVINKDTDELINNVLLILCRKQDESSCIVDTDLTSTTDEKGEFIISGIESGTYALLYSVSGNIPSDLNNTVLGYSPKSTSASPGPGNVNNLMKSLKISSLDTCNAVYEVVNGNLVVSGYVYSDDADLAFIFLSGDLIFVTITDAPVTMAIRIWDTKNKDHCDGEFKPLQENGTP
jgi:hypothetical protein